MSSELLRQFEVRSGSEESEDQGAYRDALFLGAADKLGVQRGGDSDQPFLRLGHLRQYTTRDILDARQIGLAMSHHPALYSRSCFL